MQPSAMGETLQTWLTENAWLVEIVAVSLAAALSIGLWMVLRRKLLAHSKKTAMPWDDILVHALGMPLLLLIAFLSLHHIFGIIATLLGQAMGENSSYLLLREIFIVAFLFWVLLRIVNGVESHIRHRTIRIADKEVSHSTVQLSFQIARMVIVFIIALIVMDVLGLSISGLLAFGGVGSILLGFAAKDTLTNFFSGVMIFWERPFVIGDWVRCPHANVEGTVQHIGWRMTRILTFDHRPMYVPNSVFFNSVIENPARMTNRRIYEYIGLRYEDVGKLPAVLADIRAMLDAHGDIDQNHSKMVHFDRYGASSLDIMIYVMTKPTAWGAYQYVKEEVLLAVADIVHKHGCDFAFPTRTVHHINAAPPGVPVPPPPPQL